MSAEFERLYVHIMSSLVSSIFFTVMMFLPAAIAILFSTCLSVCLCMCGCGDMPCSLDHHVSGCKYSGSVCLFVSLFVPPSHSAVFVNAVALPV